MAVGSAITGSPSIAGPDVRSRAEVALVGAILFCVALQLHLAFTKAINWDEFRFLADVHRYARGELSEALQTFHVHFFGWLLRLPLDEVDQIIVARLTMLALECVTITLIFECAHRFMPARAALVAALAYAGFSFVVGHGASFRFDPPSIALLMVAAFLLLKPSLSIGSMALAGAAVALAGLITIKSAFMLPTLVLLAAGRLLSAPDRRAAAAGLGVAAAACLVTFVGLYAAHQSSLSAADLDASRGLVAHSAGKTLGHGGIIPNGGIALHAVIGNPVAWLLIGAGVLRAGVAAVHGRGAERMQAAMLLAFALPLLTPLFYRNAFPYYYAWIMAPGALLAGFGAVHGAVAGRTGPIVLLLAGTALVHHQAAATPILATQRATIAAVHAIFPSPVAYIDRASMIGSFDKVGPFMSSWGMEVYRAGGQPIMRDLLLESSPPLLIANAPALEAALSGPAAAKPVIPLFDADMQTLRNNYVHHWGPIWVAGKRLTLFRGREQQFEILVAGRYTVETQRPINIDGRAVAPGAEVQLSSGIHHATATPSAEVVLRWGPKLPVPRRPAPDGPMFAGF